jgi:ABC-type multidrug transport system fused ATPase/permease subunit
VNLFKQSAFKIFWQTLLRHRKSFWRTLLLNIVAMAVYELAIMVIPYLMIQELMKQDVMGMASWTAVFLLLLVVRAICLRQMTKDIYRIEMRGFFSLASRLGELTEKGELVGEKEVLVDMASRWLTAWRDFVTIMGRKLLTSITCLVTGAVVLAIQSPFMMLPALVVVTLYLLLIWLRLNEGYRRAAAAAKAKNSVVGSLAAAIATKDMHWVGKYVGSYVMNRLQRAKRPLERHLQYLLYRVTVLRFAEIGVYASMLVPILLLVGHMPVERLVGIFYMAMAFVVTVTLQLNTLVDAIEGTVTALGDASPMSDQLAEPTQQLKKPPFMLRERMVAVKAVARGTSFDLEMQPGITVINKERGTGKSTLLSLIAGILEPEEGEVRIWGYSTTEYNLKDWVIFVTQQLPRVGIEGYWLFEPTTPTIRGATGIHLPLLDTPLEALSGGTSRLAYLEGALDRAEKGIIVLLLDEPTNDLDDRSVKNFLKAIQELSEWLPDLFIVIASHDERVWNIRTNPFPKW